MKIVFSIGLAVMILSACGSKSVNKETVTNPTEVNTASSKPLINPAHGMPGHDCAVSVGALLPQKGNAQPNLKNTTPVQIEAQNLPAETKKAIKLNPAHGQPGHSCEVAVGAPLS